MARYHATLETPQTTEEVFAYLSDFSTAETWDPGVLEAERLGPEPTGEGSEFRLVAQFMGRTTPLTYRIVGYDPPRAVTFLGENAMVTSRDRIVFEPLGDGTRVTYDADLQLKGALRIADPLLQVAFNRTGARALEGLRRVLSDWPSDGLDEAA
jgi:carbon monoxide dehydrogenase subunit G